jgi:hypothetical protein
MGGGSGGGEFQKFTQNRDYVKHTMYSVQTKITKYARRQENGTGDLAEKPINRNGQYWNLQTRKEKLIVALYKSLKEQL